MSKNQIQRGHILDLTAPGAGVVSGLAELVVGMLAIPQITKTAAQVAAGDDQYSGAVEGVFEIAKEPTTAVFTQGEEVFWDDGNKRVDESASGRISVGFATRAAAANDATVKVKLNGFHSTAVP